MFYRFGHCFPKQGVGRNFLEEIGGWGYAGQLGFGAVEATGVIRFRV